MAGMAAAPDRDHGARYAHRRPGRVALPCSGHLEITHQRPSYALFLARRCPGSAKHVFWAFPGYGYHLHHLPRQRTA
jgi:hypothetical protein